MSRRLAAPALAFAAALGAFSVLSGADARPAASQGEVSALTARGFSALQEARETGDPGAQDRAQVAFERARRLDPGDVDAAVGLGTLAMSRHHFRAGLRYGQEAVRRAPALARPYALLVDAQVELGRYGAGRRSVDRMVALRPDLASYARVSFQRELRGDLDGAMEAMELAVASGGPAAENAAYAQSLLAHLEALRGRRGAARRAYGEALRRVPRYVPALAGLARLDAGEGRIGRAVTRMRDVVRRQPLPEHVVALGELELQAGDARRAQERFDEQRRTMSRLGSDEDASLALLEAEHGDPQRAVRVGRRAWRSAPSVHAADALGWADARRPAHGRAPLGAARAAAGLRGPGVPDPGGAERRGVRRPEGLADLPPSRAGARPAVLRRLGAARPARARSPAGGLSPSAGAAPAEGRRRPDGGPSGPRRGRSARGRPTAWPAAPWRTSSRAAASPHGRASS